MVNTSELRGYIAKKNKSQSWVAREIKMSPTTFYSRMDSGVFGSDEIDDIVECLEMPHDDAVAIFFAPKVTQ